MKRSNSEITLDLDNSPSIFKVHFSRQSYSLKQNIGLVFFCENNLKLHCSSNYKTNSRICFVFCKNKYWRRPILKITLDLDNSLSTYFSFSRYILELVCFFAQNKYLRLPISKVKLGSVKWVTLFIKQKLLRAFGI